MARARQRASPHFVPSFERLLLTIATFAPHQGEAWKEVMSLLVEQ
jgi:hypothetical protein